MDTRLLSPAEQYGFTTGWCHLFAQVAHEQVGGTPTVLMATDPRQLAEHDWPSDLPLALHVFLTLPDGSVVDAEGRRSLGELLRSFGVRRGYKHEVYPDPTWARSHQEFGAGDGHDTVRQQLRQRLIALGWTPENVPEAQQQLAGKADYRTADAAWRNGVMQQYLDPAPPQRQRRRTPA